MLALGAWFAAGCAVGARSPNVAAHAPAYPVPADLRAGVARATSVGANLFLLDTATAVAWELLEAHIGRVEHAGLGHYLALLGASADGQPDGSVLVLFFTAGDVPQLAYRVRVIPGPGRRSELVRFDPPEIVHEPLMRLLNARLMALEALPPTRQVIHSVVLPKRGGRIVVYLLAASRAPHVAVLGKHYRAELSSDGIDVQSIVPLSDRELELPTRDSDGKPVSSLLVNAPYLEHPTETHVLASRATNLPIYVRTERGLWRVHAYDITYLGAPRASSGLRD